MTTPEQFLRSMVECGKLHPLHGDRALRRWKDLCAAVPKMRLPGCTLIHDHFPRVNFFWCAPGKWLSLDISHGGQCQYTIVSPRVQATADTQYGDELDASLFAPIIADSDGAPLPTLLLVPRNIYTPGSVIQSPR